jgi:hypothetical protein
LGQTGVGLPSAIKLGTQKVDKNSTAANKEMVFFTVQSPFQTGFDRDNVLSATKVPDHQRNVILPKPVSVMTLK